MNSMKEIASFFEANVAIIDNEATKGIEHEKKIEIFRSTDT